MIGVTLLAFGVDDLVLGASGLPALMRFGGADPLRAVGTNAVDERQLFRAVRLVLLVARTAMFPQGII